MSCRSEDLVPRLAQDYLLVVYVDLDDGELGLRPVKLLQSSLGEVRTHHGPGRRFKPDNRTRTSRSRSSVPFQASCTPLSLSQSPSGSRCTAPTSVTRRTRSPSP